MEAASPAPPLSPGKSGPWNHIPTHCCNCGCLSADALEGRSSLGRGAGEGLAHPGVLLGPPHIHTTFPGVRSTWKPESFFSIPIRVPSFALRAEDHLARSDSSPAPLPSPHLPSLRLNYPQLCRASAQTSSPHLEHCSHHSSSNKLQLIFQA